MIQEILHRGRPALRWGDQGPPVTYEWGDNAGRQAARDRAIHLAEVQGLKTVRRTVQLFAPPAPGSLSDAEIAQAVDPEELAKIKAADPHPVFKAFCIGHEGEATGNFIGHGLVKMQYLREAVQSIFHRLAVGVQAFVGHGKGSNSHAGREPVGRVAGKLLREFGQVLHTVAVIYIDPKYRDQKLDVASIETNLELSPGEDGTIHANVYEDITGIALGDGAKETPGFPGATLMGAFQAFQDKGPDTMATLEELRKAVKDGKYRPSEIYEAAELLADDTVREHVRTEKDTEYQHGKRLQSELETVREAHKKEVDTLTGNVSELNTKLLQFRTGEVFTKVAGARHLDEKQTKFIQGRLKGFKSTAKNEGDLEKEVDTFVATELEYYKQTAELFGAATEDTSGSGAGAPAQDTSQGGGQGGERDYSDPGQNDFIAVR